MKSPRDHIVGESGCSERIMDPVQDLQDHDSTNVPVGIAKY